MENENILKQYNRLLVREFELTTTKSAIDSLSCQTESTKNSSNYIGLNLSMVIKARLEMESKLVLKPHLN